MNRTGPTLALIGEEIVPVEEARVSPFDRGFLFGDGVYEMVRTFDGFPVAMDAHVRRLERSLRQTRIDGFDARRFHDIVPQLLDAERLGNAGVYLQVTRGVEHPRRHVPGDGIRPTVFAFASPLPALKELKTIESTDVILAPDDRWGRTDVKSLNVLANVLSAMQARADGADEAILHRDGLVSEGTHSTVIAVLDGALIAPSITAAPTILPGTMRGLVLDAAGKIGLPVEEGPLRVDRIHHAAEIGIASSRRLLHQVDRIGGRSLQGGPWMSRLLASMVDSITDSIDGPGRFPAS